MDYAEAHPKEFEPVPNGTKLSDLKAGDTVELHGFDCASGTVIIEQDVWGNLFFPCAKGKHYIDGQLDANNHLVGITIRPATIIPITQSQEPSMTSFNPDDADAVSRFFQGIANKVVLASTLPKEVEELRTAVESLKRDVEQYREHMQQADEEIRNLRRERQQLQDENANLRSDLGREQDRANVAESRWSQACTERDGWHNSFIALSADLETAKRERDDAQMKIMELEDSVRALSSTIDNVVRERDNLDNRLSSIRSALA